MSEVETGALGAGRIEPRRLFIEENAKDVKFLDV